MAVPEFQAFFLPVLKEAADGGPHRVRDLIEPVCDQLHVSAEDREKLLPSGKQPTVDNRVFWTAKYLRESGLLSSPRRGEVQITPLGSEILNRGLDRIDIEFLM